jgi:hypothetical protein
MNLEQKLILLTNSVQSLVEMQKCKPKTKNGLPKSPI